LAPELLEQPPSRVPTADEIEIILAPWRPQKLRRIAAQYAKGYGYECVEYHAADEWFVVLDDPDVFDFGDGWQGAYRVLPELAAPKAKRWRADECALDVSYSLQEEVDSLSETDRDKEVEEQLRINASYGGIWLLVLDREAFETDLFALKVRDEKGNVIIH
jgi:hypothetical protein